MEGSAELLTDAYPCTWRDPPHFAGFWVVARKESKAHHPLRQIHAELALSDWLSRWHAVLEIGFSCFTFSLSSIKRTP